MTKIAGQHPRWSYLLHFGPWIALILLPQPATHLPQYLDIPDLGDPRS